MNYGIESFMNDLENFLNEKLLIADEHARESIKALLDNIEEWKSD